VGDILDHVLIWCSNEMQNFVCIFHDDERVFVEGMILCKHTPGFIEFPAKLYPIGCIDWNTPVDKTALLNQFKEFHPSILAVFR
jgi:hypothetical protein